MEQLLFLGVLSQEEKMTKVLAIIKDVNPDSYVTTDVANPMSLRK